MKTLRFGTTAFLTFMYLTLHSNISNATNGMFMIGFGPKQQAVGGTTIAFAQDALAGAVNPAAIRYVKNGAELTLDIFHPRAKATLGGETQKSHSSLFGIPGIAAVMKFNKKISVGFSAVGAGGGGSRYEKNLFNNAAGSGGNPNSTMGINLMIMQMNPTVALRLNKQNSIGASLVLSIQTFRAFGLEYFSNFTRTGVNTTHLTNKGNDWSYGAGIRIGWHGVYLKKRLLLGAMASSRIYMSKFKKYKDLFAEQGDMDTPPIIGVGIAYRINKKLTIGADITKTFYTVINSIGNPPPSTGANGASIFPEGDQNRLGNDQGLGFGWRNQTVYKIGLAYDLNKNFTLRAGWNYGDTPIPNDTGAILPNLLAPAVTRHHLTFGLSYKPDKMNEFSFSYMHAFKFKEFGPTYIGNIGEISMTQDSISMGYELKF